MMKGKLFMKLYHSTRNAQLKATASQAILKGICEDGGLFVIDDFDKIDYASLLNKSFQDIANVILRCMLDDFNEDEISMCVKYAYGDQFNSHDITPLITINNDYILELYHGPTAAFKDVALQILPYFIQVALKKEAKENDILILTATSGDTGKAALTGFEDVERIKIVVFYPEVGISLTQRLQMTTQTGKNIAVCAIEGNFDDAQNGVKQLFTDHKYKKQICSYHMELSSANSINIGRLTPQIVYYFKAYLQLVTQGDIKCGEEICFSVPTGNFGDLLAGFYAKKLGLPIHRFICAVNVNNVLYDFFQTGLYDRRREFIVSSSPSMDILISSNLERLLYEVSGHNHELIKGYMNDLKTIGYFRITKDMKKQLDKLIYPSFANDQEVANVIKDVFEKDHYLMDPHSAVAYKGTLDYHKVDSQHKVISLSTASPYKFPQAICEALGLSIVSDREMMDEIEKHTGVCIPKELKNLDEKTILHRDCIKKEAMADYVLNFIKGDSL